MTLNIPSSNVSLTYFIVRLEKKTRYERICAAIKEVSNGHLKGLLGFIDDEIVSTDSIDSTCLLIFDSKASISFKDDFVKLVLWSNNERGYSNRVIDLIKHNNVIKYIIENVHEE